ncbi:SDR family oxidoreductase [Pseudomaricurvus alcaniphilus]|uniref:SDR family oxidoreductase n=1 Tax=Pseudomaricurvus alcaniphilus TaxID=1166482 RepID=UPI00140DF784|nr:SDR family oxidoreductase [Pseudomaricurvus alcaniphilus]NHN38468.1 SDR family oxidoreductase [Pseudomaricurvus alcaniphilus]
MELNRAVIAITGGAGGLGMATARRLGQAGAKIALLDLGGDALAAAEAQLREADIETVGYAVDISNEDSVEATFKKIGTDFGQLNGLLNSAGIIRDGNLVKYRDGKQVNKMSMATFQAVVNVNLAGTFLCGREAAALMIETGQPGCIINISSISAAGNMGQSNYSAAKAGVEALAVTWAKELARYKIRAAAIAPGFTDTGMLQDMKPEALQKVEKMIPLGRLGMPDEIAKTVEFILCNDYLSGRVIAVDGALRI